MPQVAMDALASSHALLFVPGDRPERFPKALASGADFVIVDFEDAVSKENKALARAALRSVDPNDGRRLLVRINPVSSPEFESDVEACLGGNVAGLMLAKTESSGDLDRVATLAGAMPLVPLIESAKGLVNLPEIAAHRITARIAFGSIDYRIDLAIPHDGIGLASARSEIVLRSRVARLPPPIDGVTPNFKDEATLSADVSVSRAFGFGGKLAIHPAQVEPIKRGMMPNSEEIAWARKILNAVNAASDASGAISVGGEMIDRPVILRATTILQRSSHLSAA